MIIVALFILGIILLVRFQKGMFAAFLVLVATKSLIDAFWDYRIGPFSVLALQGFLVPFLFFDAFKKRNIVPRFWLRTAKIYLIAMSFGIFWSLFERPVGAIQMAFLSFNSYLGFFLIPIFITDKKRLRHFLLAIIIGGLFPIIISIFQLQTGIVFQERETVGLTRYVGLYHDAFPVRFYGFMTLISILIYQHVFKINNFLFKGFLLVVAIGAFISIYAVFSKAAVGILGLWVVLLLVFSKSKIKQSLSLLVGLSVVFLVFGDVIFNNIEQLFSKEVGYQSGQVKDARYTLAGRGYIWQEHWEFWTIKQSVFFQWFGDGLNRPTHNEFLRVLMVNGIIGLCFLIVFLFRMISSSLKIYINNKMFGIMLLSMYIIDCIGLVPGVYYYYNILVWGIFATLLLKPQLFIKQKRN